MTELAGRLAVIKVSGTALNLANETLTRIDDNTWQITTATKQVLDRDVTPIIEKDSGGWADITYASVNKLSGTFTFAGAGHAAGSDIRVRVGNYLPMSTAAYAHAHTFRRGVDLHLIPAYGATHKKRLPGLKFASGTLSQWDVESSYFHDALTAGEPIVLEFRAESTGEPRRVWALLESDEMRSAIESPQDEIVTFISTDELLNW
jgi:hypothetical protein